MHKYLLLLIVIATSLSCKKNETGPGVELLFRRDFEIQTGLSPFVVHHFYLNNVSSNYAQSIAAQSLTDAQIKGVTNVAGELSAIFGDARLDFISRISVRVFPIGEPNNYIEVSYRDPAPINSGAVLGLVPSLADVKSVLREDRYNIDIAIETRTLTTENIPVRLDMKFKAEY